jgi:hypothetical protein
MRVPPYYSMTRGIALENMWHNNNECEIGLSIRPRDRLLGKNRIRKHCPYCQILNKPRLAVTTW